MSVLSSSSEHTYLLSETTVAEVAGVRIGLSNVWDDEFIDQQGHKIQAPRATLSILTPSDNGQDIRVAVNDTILLNHKTFCITHISEHNDRGSLTLTEVPHKASLALLSRLWAKLHIMPWLDIFILIILIIIPHLLSGHATKSVAAIIALLIWLALVQPNWRGLFGVFSTLLLIIAIIFFTSALFLN